MIGDQAPAPRFEQPTGPVAPVQSQPMVISGGGTPPGQAVAQQGPVTEEATLAVEYYPRARRTSMKVHAVVFLLILAGLGGVAYWYLGRTGRLPEHAQGQTAGPSGGIKIMIDPPAKATVLIDDQVSGTLEAGAEYVVKGLLPGKHRIKLTGEAFVDVENVVDVLDGKVTELYLKVEQKPPPGQAGGSGGKGP
jgi:hypothetical protein